jgi:hypothetical protein
MYREKIIAEAACGRGRTIPSMLKDLAGKVYTTFFVLPKICNYYKTNKENLGTSVSINGFKFGLYVAMEMT